MIIEMDAFDAVLRNTMWLFTDPVNWKLQPNFTRDIDLW
jgi:hypothetical protein